MEQLSGLDSMFLTTDRHGTPMNIGSVMIYDPSSSPKGAVTFADILELFEQRPIPHLRKKVVTVPLDLDQPYWVDDAEFDLEAHVHHIALPKPGGWNELFDLVADLHGRPLDRAHPLWEAYMIEGLESMEGVPKDGFALYIKCHHAAMDGQTARAIFTCLHSVEPDGETMTEIPYEEGEAEGPPGYLSMFARVYINNAWKTFHFAKTALDGFAIYQRIQKGLKAKKFRKYDDKPSTRFNGTISPHRVLGRIIAPLAEVREIKQVVEGATVNDVAITVLGGALRKYLKSKKELPKTSLIGSMPIDVRTEEDEGKGNMISAVNIAVGSNIKNPVKRLAKVHEATVEAKSFAQALGRHFLTDALESLYAGLSKWGVQALLDSGLVERVSPMGHLAISNVAGPPVAIYLSGAKLIDFFAATPLIPNCGLFHGISSNAGTFSLSFTACREMLPDRDFYIECLQESYDELKRAAEKAPKAPAAARPTKPASKKKSKTGKKVSKRKAAKKKTAKKSAKKKAAKRRPAKKRPTKS